MWFPSCHTQHTQRNGHAACDAIKKPKYAMHCTQVKNVMHATNSIFACIAFFSVFHVFALHVLRFLICVVWPACVAYGSLETDLQVRFHRPGLYVLSKPSYAAHKTQRMHGLRCNQKPEITMHARKKTQRTQSILSLRALLFGRFSYACNRALHLLLCVWQLGNRSLSPFSAFWRRWLCFDVQHI